MCHALKSQNQYSSFSTYLQVEGYRTQLILNQMSLAHSILSGCRTYLMKEIFSS
jgi:hypothetical protein